MPVAAHAGVDETSRTRATREIFRVLVYVEFLAAYSIPAMLPSHRAGSANVSSGRATQRYSMDAGVVGLPCGHSVRQESACGAFCSANADGTAMDIQDTTQRTRSSERFAHSPGRQSTRFGTPLYPSPDLAWNSDPRHDPPVESEPDCYSRRPDILHGVSADECKCPVDPPHAVPRSFTDCPSASFTWMHIAMSTITSDGILEQSSADGPDGSRDSRLAHIGLAFAGRMVFMTTTLAVGHNAPSPPVQ